MSRPRLLDLFCGAGGCAVGYHRAGFDVVGIDRRPMPRYPFAFVQADALAYAGAHGRDFQAIHASPPCQRYTTGAKQKRTSEGHPDLIAPTQALLEEIGRPWVIENVEQAGMTRQLTGAVVLCGTMFGLGVFRHRVFRASFFLLAPAHARHRGRIGDGRFVTAAGHAGGGSRRDGWKNGSTADWRRAMGIDWMTGKELAQAIPPAYTEYVGRQLLAAI